MTVWIFEFVPRKDVARIAPFSARLRRDATPRNARRCLSSYAPYAHDAPYPHAPRALPNAGGGECVASPLHIVSARVEVTAGQAGCIPPHIASLMRATGVRSLALACRENIRKFYFRGR